MSSRKRQVILSPPALQDLENILAYTFRNRGEEQERVYDRAITRAFSTLRRFPHSGRVRDDVSPHHRGYQVKQYVIFYVVDEATVTVDRILHSATDPDGQIGATPRPRVVTPRIRSIDDGRSITPAGPLADGEVALPRSPIPCPARPRSFRP